MANNNGLEIEHKYLIKMPNIGEICKIYNAKHAKISQTYLKKTKSNRRIRAMIIDSNAKYYLTEKEDISAIVRIEKEKEITKDEYESLLKEADKNLNTIIKDRYFVDYDNKIVEIDIYPFWGNYAIAEVEVDNEFAKINLPPQLEVIREVSNEKNFRNFSLAKNTDIL